MNKRLKPLYIPLAFLVSGLIVGAYAGHSVGTGSQTSEPLDPKLHTSTKQRPESVHLSAIDTALLFYAKKNSIKKLAINSDPNTTRVVLNIDNKTCWVDVVEADPLTWTPYKYLVSGSNC